MATHHQQSHHDHENLEVDDHLRDDFHQRVTMTSRRPMSLGHDPLQGSSTPQSWSRD